MRISDWSSDVCSSDLRLFEALFAALRETIPTPRMAPERTAAGNANLAFFEAYFSNFIEGMEFSVEEAEDIVFRGVIPQERPEDAHDILGTYRVVRSEEHTSELRH